MIKFLRSVRDYLSLVRFSHTVFAMPFALIGFALAISENRNSFTIKLLGLILLCMIFARNSAMGFNRITDRRFDALNPRTRNREIPSGKISLTAATVFVIANVALFILTTSFINRLVLVLSPVALIIILGYSLTKRFTYLCHFILGVGLALAPVGAYIAVTGRFTIIPVIYALIVFTWASGFDIIYSLQDDEFDKTNRLVSLATAAGRKYALLTSASLHMITIGLVILAGILEGGEYFYWTGAAIFTLLMIYQHMIVRPEDLSKVNIAFGTTNGVASILFSIFVILDIFF
jgi:4-hydroxybenzoate polyprenyltransferase